MTQPSTRPASTSEKARQTRPALAPTPRKIQKVRKTRPNASVHVSSCATTACPPLSDEGFPVIPASSIPQLGVRGESLDTQMDYDESNSVGEGEGDHLDSPEASPQVDLDLEMEQTDSDTQGAAQGVEGIVSGNGQVLTNAVEAARVRAVAHAAAKFDVLQRMVEHMAVAFEAAEEAKDPAILHAVIEIRNFVKAKIDALVPGNKLPKSQHQQYQKYQQQQQQHQQPKLARTFAQAATAGLSSSIFAKSTHTHTSTHTHALPSKPSKAMPLTPPRGQDHRLFVRLDQDSPLREADLDCIRARVQQVLPAGTEIRPIQRTATGLAIAPGNSQAVAILQQNAEQIAALLQAKAVETQIPWKTVRLEGIPRIINALDLSGNEWVIAPREVSLEDLKAELSMAFKTEPTRLFWKEEDPTSGTAVAIASFIAAEVHFIPESKFLFSRSIRCKVLPTRRRITQCNKCWGHHRPEHCSRKAACKACGSTEHLLEAHPTPTGCLCRTKCINCHGTHSADAVTCPLRPCHNRNTGVLVRATRERTKTVREANNRLRTSAPHPVCPLHHPKPGPPAQEASPLSQETFSTAPSGQPQAHPQPHQEDRQNRFAPLGDSSQQAC